MIAKSWLSFALVLVFSTASDFAASNLFYSPMLGATFAALCVTVYCWLFYFWSMACLNTTEVGISSQKLKTQVKIFLGLMGVLGIGSWFVSNSKEAFSGWILALGFIVLLRVIYLSSRTLIRQENLNNIPNAGMFDTMLAFLIMPIGAHFLEPRIKVLTVKQG